MWPKVKAWFFRPAPELSIDEKLDKVLHVLYLVELDYWVLVLTFFVIIIRLWR